MTGADGVLSLAWVFVHPVHLPSWARLWMLLPLVACVATVYRATRARNARQLPRSTLVSFVTIVVGMVLIAAAFFVVHFIVRRYL
jgi:1,4-dihydroxy-2-naphthoate octaprenyltransferase